MELKDILIDKDIKKVSSELTEEEFKQLEKNILDTGELDSPLIIWKGENILLDGHNRYRVLMMHPEIKFTIKEMEFNEKNDAILWACCNQIGRLKLTPRRYEMLIGTAYNMTKKSRGGDRGTERDEHGNFVKAGASDKNRTTAEDTENSTKIYDRTREKIAKEFGTTPSKVRSAAEIASAVVEADEIQPGFREAYESGEIKATKQEIKRILTVGEGKKPEAVRAIMENDGVKKEELGIKKTKEPKTERKGIAPSSMSVPERVSQEHSVTGLQKALENAFAVTDESLGDILLEYADVLNTLDGQQATVNAVSAYIHTLGDYRNRIREAYWH